MPTADDWTPPNDPFELISDLEVYRELLQLALDSVRALTLKNRYLQEALRQERLKNAVFE